MTQTKQKDKAPPAARTFKIQVDDKPVTVEEPVVTGARIKELAGVDPQFGLVLEGHGRDPDRQISDGETVDLREPGRESFYTVPPATFGSGW